MSVYYLRYWFFALLASLFMVLEVGVDLLQPRMMAEIVDEGILGLHNNGNPDIAKIVSLGVRMVIIVIAGLFSGVLSAVFTNFFSQKTGNALRKDCFRKVMQFSFSDHGDFSSGTLITRLTSDITQIQNMSSQVIRGAVRALMFLVVGSIALLALSADFGQVLLIAFPIIIAEIVFVLWKSGPLFTSLQNRMDDVNQVLQENIRGIRVVKAFAQEEREDKRFSDVNELFSDTQFKTLFILSTMSPVLNIILNLAVVGTVWLGAGKAETGDIAAGSIMAAVTYLSQIFMGIMMFAMIFQNVTRGLASRKRVLEVIRHPLATTNGNIITGPTPGTVEFCNVSFGYPGSSEDALTDISFSVAPGETLGIIGATGSGKSSIVNLIPRFYDATAGIVKVDGVDVRTFVLDSLRKKVGTVLQKSELLSTSIRDNITLCNPDASQEEIMKASKTAQADEFIQRQPKLYETEIAEGDIAFQVVKSKESKLHEY